MPQTHRQARDGLKKTLLDELDRRLKSRAENAMAGPQAGDNYQAMTQIADKYQTTYAGAPSGRRDYTPAELGAWYEIVLADESYLRRRPHVREDLDRLKGSFSLDEKGDQPVSRSWLIEGELEDTLPSAKESGERTPSAGEEDISRQAKAERRVRDELKDHFRQVREANMPDFARLQAEGQMAELAGLYLHGWEPAGYTIYLTSAGLGAVHELMLESGEFRHRLDVLKKLKRLKHYFELGGG